MQNGEQNQLHIYQQNNVVYVLGWSKDGNGHEVMFEIRDQKMISGCFPLEISFDVWAFKDGKRKLVAPVKNKPGEYVKLTGYIQSPYEERIALILADEGR